MCCACLVSLFGNKVRGLFKAVLSNYNIITVGTIINSYHNLSLLNIVHMW